MVLENVKVPLRKTKMFDSVILFLLSEVFLFGALFFTYFYLRINTPVWPPQGVELDMARPIANTIVLLSSSIAIALSSRFIRQGRASLASPALGATILLGLVFLGVTGWEWASESFSPSSHAYGSIFFTLTGFHALHVLGGVLLLLALWRRMRLGKVTSDNHRALEFGSLYWHFVDLIWVFVFVSLFIIR